MNVMNSLSNILDYLLITIEEANLATLFFTLVLGVVLAPINRETIVVFMALLGASNAIHPLMAFIITTFATFIGYNLGFFLGRGLKGNLLTNPSPKTKKKLDRSYQLLEKHGTLAIILSYFIPGVRHFLPVILGMGTMPLSQFLIISKAGSIVWTLAFYLPGYFLGDNWTSFFISSIMARIFC